MAEIFKYWAIAIHEAVRGALKSLWRHKLRSGLTLLSILIGVATIIIIVSIISGLNKKIASEFETLGTNVLYVNRFPWVASGREWAKYRKNPPITYRDWKALEGLPHAEYVVPYFHRGAKVRYRQDEMDISLFGTTWEFPQIRKVDLAMGRFFSWGEDRRGRPVCVIGWDIYHNLFGDEQPLGKWVDINGAKFRVIGVIKRQGQSLTIGSMDSRIFIPYNAFVHTFGGRFGIGIMVAAPSPEFMDELTEEIRYALRGARGLKLGQPDNFAINSQDMLLDRYNQITHILWTVLIAIAALSLLVGGIGVMNIMLISVAERTREIGIRKAIGATRAHILSQFLLEALTQCWLGGAIGFLVGVGLPLGVSLIVPQLPVAISWESVAAAIIFTTAVGVIFGLYPAVKAGKLSPVEALRYE